MPKLARNAVTDSGFWIALSDGTDEHHTDAIEKEAGLLARLNVVLPWPCLYETIRTRLVRNRVAVQQFEGFLSRHSIAYIDDAPYRREAYEQTLSLARIGKRSISLTDMVIRFVLADVNVKSDYLVTFNPGDFHDVCRSHRIEIL